MTQELVGTRFANPISKGQVSKIEAKGATGRIGAETVAAYAEAINRHPKELYGPPPQPDERPTLDQTAADLNVNYDDAVRALRIMAGRAA
jgi:hypothetical protein